VAVDEEEQVVDDVNDAVRDGDVWPDHACVDAVVADVNWEEKKSHDDIWIYYEYKLAKNKRLLI